VDYNHIVKGYDLGGGRYVVMEPEELASIDVDMTRNIDIEEFVDLAEIDPVYFEKSYYLVPDGRADKPYALLVETMERSGKVALGRFVLRTKQYLAALRARDGVLVLSTMLYADEVVDPEELEVPTAADTSPSERELKMASQLVESLSAPFDPAKYRDDYREKVLALIEAKADGEIITPPEPAGETAPVVDLMAALEASLARAKQSA
jgi:DNA end-binding protein Ku